MTVIVACIRVDALSVLYLILMLFFLFTHRTVASRLWAAYMAFLGFLLIFQYAACSKIPSYLMRCKFTPFPPPSHIFNLPCADVLMRTR